MAGVSTVVAGFSTGVPTLSAAFSVAFSAATAVLRTLVVAPLAEVVAFLVAFLVVVLVRLAAVRVRLADLVTSVWKTMVWLMARAGISLASSTALVARAWTLAGARSVDSSTRAFSARTARSARA